MASASSPVLGDCIRVAAIGRKVDDGAPPSYLDGYSVSSSYRFLPLVDHLGGNVLRFIGATVDALERKPLKRKVVTNCPGTPLHLTLTDTVANSYVLFGGRACVDE